MGEPDGSGAGIRGECGRAREGARLTDRSEMTVPEADTTGRGTSARKHGHEMYEGVGGKGGQRVKSLTEAIRKTTGQTQPRFAV